MSKEIPVSRRNCRAYFKKGREFSDYAKIAMEGGAHDVAASNAIHASILFLDSLNIADLGVKSGSEHHSDTIALFRRVSIRHPNLRKEKDGVIRSFLLILEKKGAAEYMGEGMSKGGAESIIHNMEKIMRFVSTELEQRSY